MEQETSEGRAATVALFVILVAFSIAFYFVSAD
jgi:hypothetical protein